MAKTVNISKQMENIHKEFNLRGNPNIMKISRDGNYVMICDYEGGINIFGLKEGKSIYKVRVKGPKSNLPIHNCDISFDSRFFAFSCLSKVFVVDVQQKQIVKEIEYSKADELMCTISFCFYKTENKIVVPSGKVLMVYDMESPQYFEIPLPADAGKTDDVAISWNDDIIAYKSRKDEYVDKLLLIDIKTSSIKEIALPYPRSHHQLYMCCLTVGCFEKRYRLYLF